MNKPHAIITGVNKRCGDFLVAHWLPSLRANVNLAEIDIIVVDYGLSPLQRGKMEHVHLISGKEKGHITVVRFKEILNFLSKAKYSQILAIDGGDILFQRDISFLFQQDKSTVRVVEVGTHIPMYFFLKGFKADTRRRIRTSLQDKPLVNSGFILAPSHLMKVLCRRIIDLISNQNLYGPDQLAVNYILQDLGYKSLDKEYNFDLGRCLSKTYQRNGFYVRNGCFYNGKGEIIAIVHNTGNKQYLRVVKNFGHGKQYNKLKLFMPLLRYAFRESYAIEKRLFKVI